jgi:hypothetical protein
MFAKGLDRSLSMRLTFLGKDSQPNNSPTLYAADNDAFVVQGWIVTSPEVLAATNLADDETIVEIPAKLLRYLERAGLVGDVTNLVTPIVYVTDDGNYIIKGKRVPDPETLAQMHIPDNETCVEVSPAAVAALIGG